MRDINQTRETIIEVPNFVNSSYDMVAQNPVQNSRFKISSVMEYSDEVEKGYIAEAAKVDKTFTVGFEDIYMIFNANCFYIVILEGEKICLTEK